MRMENLYHRYDHTISTVLAQIQFSGSRFSMTILNSQVRDQMQIRKISSTSRVTLLILLFSIFSELQTMLEQISVRQRWSSLLTQDLSQLLKHWKTICSSISRLNLGRIWTLRFITRKDVLYSGVTISVRNYTSQVQRVLNHSSTIRRKLLVVKLLLTSYLCNGILNALRIS
jgi:hypothetical protein